MDLGLLQREVAEIIGVTVSLIYNWEHGGEPELQYNPRIIKFLGYIQFDCPADMLGRLAYYKRVNGMLYVNDWEKLWAKPLNSERIGCLADKTDPQARFCVSAVARSEALVLLYQVSHIFQSKNPGLRHP